MGKDKKKLTNISNNPIEKIRECGNVKSTVISTLLRDKHVTLTAQTRDELISMCEKFQKNTIGMRLMYGTVARTDTGVHLIKIQLIS